MHLALAVAGPSVVLARYPEALTAIRLAGGLYLLYLGGRLIVPTLRRSTEAAEESGDASTRSAIGAMNEVVQSGDLLSVISDQACIGVNVDELAVLDPEVLLACLQEALDEVAAIGR